MKLLAIDGNSILNRAFYGIRPLSTADGLPTNALFGFLNILLRQLEETEPTHAAVAFDLKAPTFRHKAFDGYKAGRRPMPDELKAQLPFAKDLCRALGFTVLEKEGFEADDILGTLAATAENAGMDADILTGDRDALQLIDGRVNVLLAGNAETKRFDVKAFTEKYGVDPSVYVEVKALMGDSSDNIPGVRGVGEKTAFALIKDYGSLDALYARLDESPLPPKQKEKLREGEKDARLSRFLSEIKKDVPLGIGADDLAYPGFRRGELFALLSRLEFTAAIKKLGLDRTETASQAPKAEAETVSLSSLGKGPFAVRTEEDGILVSDGEKTFRLASSDYPAFLRNGEKKKVFLSSKEAYRASLAAGEEAEGIVFDLSLAAYVLDPSDGTAGVDRLAAKYLPGEVFSDEGKRLFALYKVLKEKTAGEKEAFLCEKIEFPLAKTLAEMEDRGFSVDRDRLEAYGKALEREAKELEERITFAAGREFNVNSPKQLGEVLFEEMGLPHGKKTKSGYSTSAEILEELRFSWPVVDDILEYRQLTKLKGTYTDGLAKVISPDGRIHTNFNQALTQTGRLSYSEPNLQNIPVRTERGKELRRCFVPKEGYLLVDADYSQIELRLLAHIANDSAMLEAFRNGEDIHTSTASQVFRVPVEMVTPELRKRAKAVNFGIVYGIGDYSLSRDLGISKKRAGEYIDAYLSHYAGIRDYLENAVREAKAKGYTETIFGRKRFIPELSSPKAALRAFGERVAMNSPIQGSSADIIKLAMIRADERLKREGVDAALILQVHDELVVEARADQAERAAVILKEEMEGAVSLSLPLTVEVKTGSDWLEAH